MRISGRVVALAVVFSIALSGVALACHSNFFNEVFLRTDMEAKDAFDKIGVSDADFGGAVASWNTGTVSVPAYDIQSIGDQTVGQGYVLLELTGVSLDSWNVDNN